MTHGVGFATSAELRCQGKGATHGVVARWKEKRAKIGLGAGGGGRGKGIWCFVQVATVVDWHVVFTRVVF